MDDEGEGGRGRYVDRSEFKAFCEEIRGKVNRQDLALFGEDGRDGLCHDVAALVQTIKTWGVVYGIGVSIGSGVIVAVLIKLLHL